MRAIEGERSGNGFSNHRDVNLFPTGRQIEDRNRVIESIADIQTRPVSTGDRWQTHSKTPPIEQAQDQTPSGTILGNTSSCKIPFHDKPAIFKSNKHSEAYINPLPGNLHIAHRPLSHAIQSRFSVATRSILRTICSVSSCPLRYGNPSQTTYPPGSMTTTWGMPETPSASLVRCCVSMAK